MERSFDWISFLDCHGTIILPSTEICHFGRVYVGREYGHGKDFVQSCDETGHHSDDRIASTVAVEVSQSHSTVRRSRGLCLYQVECGETTEVAGNIN